MTARRLLLLIPHPDDEVVGAAIVLRRAVAQGAQAFALYLTTGVPARAALWPWQRRHYEQRIARRRNAARDVADALALRPIGFQPWPSRSLKAHLGEALALIDGAIAELGIEALWVPAWEGAHQDHDSANFLASRFVGRLPVSEFAEYNFAGGKARSGAFPEAKGNEETLRLTPAEQAWKRDLLARYRSERANLAHIRLASEALRPLAVHDYSRPAHPGRQFWERFHWVPFRHPRIDFDRAAEVRAALSRFAAPARDSAG
jgi:LmbE family N-acetylglucosaminyl deacetylase